MMDLQTQTTSRDELSIYSVNELPSWSEIMEWYDLFAQDAPAEMYDPDNSADTGDLDMHWNIPKKLVYIAHVCNQFNKMIIMDGFRESIVTCINDIYSSNDVADVIFTAVTIPRIKKAGLIKCNQDMSGISSIDSVINQFQTDFAIYGIDGKNDVFADLRVPHVYINELTYLRVMVAPVVKFHDGDKVIVTPYVSMYKRVIEFMMVPFKQYFTEPIGWKHDDGSPIVSTVPNKPYIGYDPAK